MRVLSLILAAWLMLAGPAGAVNDADMSLAKQRQMHVTSRVDPLWDGWLVRIYVDDTVTLADADLHMQLEAARFMREEGETRFVVVERRPVLFWNGLAPRDTIPTDRTPRCGSRGRGTTSECGRWGRAGRQDSRTERAARALRLEGRGVGGYVIGVAEDDPDARSVEAVIIELETRLSP